MSDQRKRSSHRRQQDRNQGRSHQTREEDDRYNQEDQDDNRNGIVDQRSYPQPQTVSYSEQHSASYLPQGPASYQHSGTGSYTSQETASYQQQGTTSYQQQETASYPEQEPTSFSGTWAQDSGSNNYPRALNVRAVEELPNHDQEQSGYNRDHRSRCRNQQGYARRPSVAENAVGDHASQRYPGPTGYPAYPQGHQYDNGNATASMGTNRFQQTSFVAMSGGQFYSTGESSYGFPTSQSAGLPSNSQSGSGLSPRLRRLSLSSNGPMAPLTSHFTPPSSLVGSPGGDFSEDVYSASPPTTQPHIPSRRNSFVPIGESAGTHRRRRSSDTSGSYQRRDSSQSGFLPVTGTRRTSTFPIPEATSPGRSDDSQTSQNGSGDESRRTRLTGRGRDSFVSSAHEGNRTSQDKKNKKNQKNRTDEYLDKQRETNWWNNQKGPEDPRDQDDGSGGYVNGFGYPMHQ